MDDQWEDESCIDIYQEKFSKTICLLYYSDFLFNEIVKIDKIALLDEKTLEFS